MQAYAQFATAANHMTNGQAYPITVTIADPTNHINNTDDSIVLACGRYHVSYIAHTDEAITANNCGCCHTERTYALTPVLNGIVLPLHRASSTVSAYAADSLAGSFIVDVPSTSVLRFVATLPPEGMRLSNSIVVLKVG